MYSGDSRSQVWTEYGQPFNSAAPARTDATDGRNADTPYRRVAFLTSEGRLALESEGSSPPVPLESIEPEILRRAVSANQTMLRASIDAAGRTLILAYVPAAAVYLVSLNTLGESVRQIARGYGLTRLSARVCAGLVETGSLRRAAKACGVAYQTAQSEVADALQAAGAANQSALICELAAGWLTAPVDSDRAARLLMTTFGLNARDARIAGLIASGQSRLEAGMRLGVSKWAIKSSCTRIFATLGVAKSPELTRVVIDLMLAAELVTDAG